MKFALQNGQRREPSPGSLGRCPGCGQETIAKCGTLRLWHWAHKTRQPCNAWRERETDWHRAWKSLFPKDWQEVPRHAKNGEIHIADIQTPEGLVLEFQHSAIRPDERISRERSHKRMLWIVDGTRLKNDRPRVDNRLRGWRNLKAWEPNVANHPDLAFPKRWLDSNVPVLFDFDGLTRDEDFPDEHAHNAPSVLRDRHWWHSRTAKPDPLVYLLPSPRNRPGTYLIIDRVTFLEAVTNRPEILDPRHILKKLLAKQANRKRNYLAMRGKRSRF